MQAKPEGINTLNGIYNRAKLVEGQTLKLGESIQIDRSGYIYLSNIIKNLSMEGPAWPKQKKNKFLRFSIENGVV